MTTGIGSVILGLAVTTAVALLSAALYGILNKEKAVPDMKPEAKVEGGKRVVLANNCVRFYPSDGWSYGLLNQYVRKGFLMTLNEDGVDFIVLDGEAVVDIEALIKDGHVGKVEGEDRYTFLRTLSDVDALREQTW